MSFERWKLKDKTAYILIGSGIVFAASVWWGATLLGDEPSFAVGSTRVITGSYMNLSLPPEAASFEEHISYMWPIHPQDYLELSSPFGERNAEEVGGSYDHFHQGIDLYGLWNARIVASADGVVQTHYPPPDGFWKGHDIFGGYISIIHDDGSETRYGHLSSTEVHEGQRVKRGDYIARQGDTGISRGQHLHFEIRIDGLAVNPLKYLEGPE